MTESVRGIDLRTGRDVFLCPACDALVGTCQLDRAIVEHLLSGAHMLTPIRTTFRERAYRFFCFLSAKTRA